MKTSDLTTEGTTANDSKINANHIIVVTNAPIGDIKFK
jgi:hypothetical protein